MLQINKRSPDSSDVPSRPEAIISDSFKNIMRILNRQRPIASVVFICCFALGMLYYITTLASYTAEGTIVIDKRKFQLFQKESVLGDVEVDTAAVQTEVEVLKSDNIGLSVVRKLHLADDPEFVGGGRSAIGNRP
jgi:succinoglycan biosynthesis transport protein ExoP